jgi:dihydropteroate synthase
MIIKNIEYDFSKLYLMGIVNITPDSFSDGGHFLSEDQAIKQIELLIKDGADFIDIGAESSRPGAEPVSVSEEIKRLAKVLTKYSRYFEVPLSLDTYKAEVADYGLSMGVNIINDISGLKADPNMAQVVKKHSVPVILMHMRGTPKNMQESPKYEDVVNEVFLELKESIDLAKKNEIDKIIIDPGIGFGKNVYHNLTLIKNLDVFKSLGHPLLVGTSRKSFIGHITADNDFERLSGTIASNLLAFQNGANILRVHDIGNIKKAVQVLEAIEQPEEYLEIA